jgi:hypothetical protein
MPQLDKFTYFNQIIYLTIFFSLIYIYIRGTVVPNFSTLLKFRKKKINSIFINIKNDTNHLELINGFFDTKGKNLLLFLNKYLDKINYLYFNNIYIQFINLYSNFYNTILNNSILFFYKNRIEFFRLNITKNN